MNFNNSYYFEYSKTEINESHDENKECFIYNKDLDAAGYFKEYYYDYDEFIPLFYEVIYKDDRFGEYISFVDYSDGLDGFNYNGIATKTKSVLVYKEIDEKYPYKDYFKFNKDIFENSTYKIEENTLKIQYKNELEDHSYTTQFLYNLDENKNVNSFKGVECEIKDDNYIYTYIYQPRYDEKELKAYFATEEKRLNGYIIKAEDLRRFFEGEKSVVINQNVDPNDLSLVQEKLYELFYELNSETNIFETYDFVLDYITDTDILEYAITDILVNDVDSGMSVLYDNDLVKGIKAAGNNNFTKYQPQVYIYNKLNSGYDLEFNEAIADVSDIIHEDIYNVFDELSMYAVPLCDYYYENTYLVAEYNVYKTSYKFYFKKRNHEFVLNKIDIKRSRGNYHYHYVAYVENKFDIDRSMFK